MNIYLIASESYKLLENEVNKIINTSSNVVKYDGRINSLNEVINEAGYFSLTGDMKYIIYKECDLFKSTKNDSSDVSKNTELLESFFNNLPETSTIIFTLSSLPDKRKKAYKLIDQNGKVIIINTLNKKEMVYECMNILKKNKYSVDYETGNFIVENSFTNYDIMLNQLDKIYTLLKPGMLTIKELKNVISLSMNDNIYAYINAIIERDLYKASNAMKYFEQLKIDPMMVLIMIYKEFNILYLINSKTSPKDIQSLYGKQDWQMDAYMKNADKYTINELKKIITILHRYDSDLKTGVLDKSVALSLLSLELCE